MNILVVDDDPILLELAQDALEVMGHETIERAEGAAEAFALIGGERPPFDVILLDIMMPDIDGIEACRRFRSMKGLENTVIIMMTALSDREHIDAAFRAGANDYVTKPVDPADLESRINLNIARRTGAGTRVGDTETADETPMIDGLVAQGTLENYILALDRARASLSVATAFSVEIAPDGATDQLLEIAGRCIVQEVSKTSCLAAYFGRSTFICISKQGDPMMSRAMVKRIGEALQSEAGDSVKIHRRVMSNVKCGKTMIADIQEAVAAPVSAKSTRKPSFDEVTLPDIFA